MRKSNEKISLKKWENPTEFLLPLDREFDHCWVEKGGEWKEIRSDSSFIFASNRVSSSSRLRIRFVSVCASSRQRRIFGNVEKREKKF